MGRAKRATLQPRSEGTRRNSRRKVTINGACRIGEREKEEVLVTSLGSDGCSVQADAVGVTKSEPLEMWLGELGPLAAQLRWARAGTLGVAFEESLTEDVLEKLYRSSTLETVVPFASNPPA